MAFGKKKNSVPDLNMEQADEMLSQILEQCKVPPNTITLEELVSYGNYRKEKYLFQRIGIVIILILFMFLPFFFISPKFTLTQEGGDYNTYVVTVNSIMPVAYVSASIDGHYVPIYQADDKVYKIEPTINGDMYITVGGKNGQTVTHEITVTTVDSTAPTVDSYTASDQYLTLYVSDDMSGVDYQGIYAEDASGTIYEPVSCDEASGRIDFNYPTSAVNITIPDKQGNEIKLLVDLE